jgi:hypothetical protein
VCIDNHIDKYGMHIHMCICAHVQVIHVMIERIPYICPRILNVTMCVRACGMYIFMYVCAFVYIYIYIYVNACTYTYQDSTFPRPAVAALSSIFRLDTSGHVYMHNWSCVCMLHEYIPTVAFRKKETRFCLKSWLLCVRYMYA